VSASASASFTATARPLAEPLSTTEAIPVPAPLDEELPVRTDPEDGVEDERALPTWVRVAIVVAALVAFFAVSLIATKQV
jgi:hypothetical protein